jgi:hypothetical protein
VILTWHCVMLLAILCVCLQCREHNPAAHSGS